MNFDPAKQGYCNDIVNDKKSKNLVQDAKIFLIIRDLFYPSYFPAKACQRVLCPKRISSRYRLSEQLSPEIRWPPT